MWATNKKNIVHRASSEPSAVFEISALKGAITGSEIQKPITFEWVMDFDHIWCMHWMCGLLRMRWAEFQLLQFLSLFCIAAVLKMIIIFYQHYFLHVLNMSATIAWLRSYNWLTHSLIKIRSVTSRCVTAMIFQVVIFQKYLIRWNGILGVLKRELLIFWKMIRTLHGSKTPENFEIFDCRSNTILFLKNHWVYQ